MTYWKNKVKPLLVASFENYYNFDFCIHKASVLPFFDNNFEIINSKVIIQDIEDIASVVNKDHMINAEFQEEILHKWPDGFFLYTDGSISKDGVGCSVVDPLNSSFHFDKIIIFTDSLSSIHTLKSFSISYNNVLINIYLKTFIFLIICRNKLLYAGFQLIPEFLATKKQIC